MKRPQSSLCECEIRGLNKGLWNHSFPCHLFSLTFILYLTLLFHLFRLCSALWWSPAFHTFFIFISSIFHPMKHGQSVTPFSQSHTRLFPVVKKCKKNCFFLVSSFVFFPKLLKSNICILKARQFTTYKQSQAKQFKAVAWIKVMYNTTYAVLWSCQLCLNGRWSADFVIAGGSERWLYVVPWCVEVGS